MITDKDSLKSYQIERRLELISGEPLENEPRSKIEKMIQEFLNDLFVIIVNINSYKKIMASEGGAFVCQFSNAFMYAYSYSIFSANSLLISNFFDNDPKVLSFSKLINCIEQEKDHVEVFKYQIIRRPGEDWVRQPHRPLTESIRIWRKQLKDLSVGTFEKIKIIRDMYYAHKDKKFGSLPEADYNFNLIDLTSLLGDLKKLLDDISVELFDRRFGFFDFNTGDIEQTLNALELYYQFKKEILEMKRVRRLEKNNKD